MKYLRLGIIAVLAATLVVGGYAFYRIGFGAQQAADVSWIANKTLDLPYGDKSSSQKLDLYYPNNSNNEAYPLIVYVHGGAFKMGDKSGNILGDVLEGTKRGYAVASINYRLSSEAKFPAALQDVKQAIRYLKTNAKKHRIDPNKIIVWGESAGGNLAAMVGVTGDCNDFDTSEQSYNVVDSKVSGVVDWFGPIDFLSMDSDFKTLGVTPAMGNTDSESSPESEYIGTLISKDPATVQKANPISYISKADPDFFIQHGTADGNVPYLQSKKLADALIKIKGSNSVTFELLEGAGHGDGGFGGGKAAFSTADNLNKIFLWIDKTVGRSN